MHTINGVTCEVKKAMERDQKGSGGGMGGGRGGRILCNIIQVALMILWTISYSIYLIMTRPTCSKIFKFCL